MVYDCCHIVQTVNIIAHDGERRVFRIYRHQVRAAGALIEKDLDHDAAVLGLDQRFVAILDRMVRLDNNKFAILDLRQYRITNAANAICIAIVRWEVQITVAVPDWIFNLGPEAIVPELRHS